MIGSKFSRHVFNQSEVKPKPIMARWCTFSRTLCRLCVIDLFTDTAAILISIVSNSHYGMPRGQINMYFPPGHPIISFETIEIKMAAISVKRSITSRFYCFTGLSPSFLIGQSNYFGFGCTTLD